MTAAVTPMSVTPSRHPLADQRPAAPLVGKLVALAEGQPEWARVQALADPVVRAAVTPGKAALLVIQLAVHAVLPATHAVHPGAHVPHQGAHAPLQVIRVRLLAILVRLPAIRGAHPAVARVRRTRAVLPTDRIGLVGLLNVTEMRRSAVREPRTIVVRVKEVPPHGLIGMRPPVGSAVALREATDRLVVGPIAPRRLLGSVLPRPEETVLM